MAEPCMGLPREASSNKLYTFDPAGVNETKSAWQKVIEKSECNRKAVPVVYGLAPVAAALDEVDCRSRFLSSSKSSKITDTLRRIVLEGNYSVLSFDVFDTLLLRNDKPEAVRYLEMSEHILEQLKSKGIISERNHLNALDLCLARVNALQVNYRIRKPVSGCVEGHINEVIAIQVRSLDLPVEAELVFLEEEIAYEVKNLEANKVLTEIAEDFKKQGGEVVLVSDMYLDGESIETIVNRVIGKKIYKNLYSSADLVVSKRSGKIFSKVEKDLDCEASRVIHIGDSFTGDVSKPRDAGWSTLHFPVSRAESDRRTVNLKRFIENMAHDGIDVSSWAKV